MRGQETIFHGLLRDSYLHDSEKSVQRLTDEALTIIGAGTVTTAHTLTVIMWNLLSDQTALLTLRKELDLAITKKTRLSWDDLSNLPYLSAVVNEGLRLSFGVSHRLQRISPAEPLRYKEWIIPLGTPVSMTQMFLMQDPSIFPRPHEFIPERWLDTKDRGNRYKDVDFPDPRLAKKFLVPFSRGTRACLGINLAYSEIFLTLGTLLRPVTRGGLEWELYDTNVADMEIAHDFFNPSASLRSRGLRVLVQ
jgi:cytochrome P450